MACVDHPAVEANRGTVATLEHELRTDTGVLIVRPKGPLSTDDFAALTTDADSYIDRHGRLRGLMICAQTFPGWQGRAGAIAHFKFVRDHHRTISRVAFVSDSGLLTLLPELADHFVGTEVKHFKRDEEAKALAWIAG